MIEPTVGRVVWFTPRQDQPHVFSEPFSGYNAPFAAHIAYVHNATCVNLMVIRPDGAGVVGFTSVQLLQESIGVKPLTAYAEWMPYQVGQAKKHEADKAT